MMTDMTIVIEDVEMESRKSPVARDAYTALTAECDRRWGEGEVFVEFHCDVELNYLAAEHDLRLPARYEVRDIDLTVIVKNTDGMRLVIDPTTVGNEAFSTAAEIAKCLARDKVAEL